MTTSRWLRSAFSCASRERWVQQAHCVAHDAAPAREAQSRPDARRHPAGGAVAQHRRAAAAAGAGLLRGLHAARLRAARRFCASFGAIDRSDENRQRFATVEVRVGDYQLDNTHPIRGDARAQSPRLVQVSLPLSDEEKPIRLALWRATDRSYKQASEALTRVRDERRRKSAGRESRARFLDEKRSRSIRPGPHPIRSTRRHGKRGCGRVSAVFSEDPLVLRSQVSLTVEADNRYFVNSEGSQIVTGDVGGRIFIQGVTKAEDGMELPLYTSYFATSPDGLPDERQLHRRGARDGRPARAASEGAARRAVLGSGHPLRARGRRVLPRDFRPSRRRQPPAQRRRRTDVHEQGRPAGAARVSERHVRSHGEETRKRRADGALPLRRSGREGAARDGRRRRRAQDVSARPRAAEELSANRTGTAGRRPGSCPCRASRTCRWNRASRCRASS